MPIEIELKPVEAVLFRSDVVAVCSFRCPSTHPLFHDSGPCSSHTFVFPRTATEIRHRGGDEFVGSPDCVSLYNRGQEYSRRAISDEDWSDWFVVADDVLFDALGDRERPFRASHVPVDAATYLEQRQLFERLSRGDQFDPLQVEETVIGIFRRIVAERPAKKCVRRVRIAQSVVASSFRENLSLRAIAAAADATPFQLCRDFRAVTGKTLTSFKHSLRLRTALAHLRSTRDDLTDVALDLGYSSHSHFTSVFRRHFGVTPSQYRDSHA